MRVREERRGSAMGRLAALTAVLLLLGATAPAVVVAEDVTYEEAEGPLKECLDTVTLDYNKCLMEAGTRWERFVCDLIWQAEWTACWSEIVGEIKDNLEGPATGEAK